jgi:hypothetical protein
VKASAGAEQGCQMFFSNQTIQFWYLLEVVGNKIFHIFYDHFLFLVAICYVLWLFFILSPFLEFCIKNNLATLVMNIEKTYHFNNYFFNNKIG